MRRRFLPAVPLEPDCRGYPSVRTRRRTAPERTARGSSPPHTVAGRGAPCIPTTKMPCVRRVRVVPPWSYRLHPSDILQNRTDLLEIEPGVVRRANPPLHINPEG